MSDLRQLPLLGHDIPDYRVMPLATLNRAPRAPERPRARVYKDTIGWTWSHACGPHPPWVPSGSWGVRGAHRHEWAASFEAARWHMRLCRR